MSNNRKDRQVEELLARAALFRMLAQAFAYPAPGHVRAVNAAFARLEKARAADSGRPRLTRVLERARRAWRRADEDALAREYMRLFLGSGPVSLHETAYGDGRRIAGRAVELADINGFYSAFGFTQSDADPDLPDHLCAELEFYSLLQVKDAYARAHGLKAPAAVTRDAARTFLAQHLGRWIAALAESLAQHEAASPYRESVALLTAMIETEARRLRICPEPATGRLPQDMMQEEAFTCPQAAAAQ